MGNHSSHFKKSIPAILVISGIGYTSYKMIHKTKKVVSNKKKLFSKINFDDSNTEIAEIKNIFAEINQLEQVDPKLASKYLLSIEVLINKLLKEQMIESEKLFVKERRQFLDELPEYFRLTKTHMNCIETKRLHVLEQILQLCSIKEDQHVFLLKMLFENNTQLMSTVQVLNETEKVKALADELVYVSLDEAKNYIKTKTKTLEDVCNLQALKELKQSNTADVYGVIVHNYIVDITHRDTGISEENIFIRSEITSDSEFIQLHQEYSTICLNKIFK
jgi:hypothetical protein